MVRNTPIALIALAGLAVIMGAGGQGASCGLGSRRSAVASSHRAVSTACATERGPGSPQPVGGTCRADADCTQGRNGRCSPRGGGRMPAENTCAYDACFTDDECGPHGLCMCTHAASEDGAGHYCLQGNCRTDAECGAGGFCSPSARPCGYGATGYFCHTRRDDCTNDNDCQRTEGDTRCVFAAEVGYWACRSRVCPVG